MKGRKLGLKINDLEQKEEVNIQPEKNEKKIQKMRRGLGTSVTTLSALASEIIGVPEGEEQEQEIENLLKKIMKDNFSNLVKEIDF